MAYVGVVATVLCFMLSACSSTPPGGEGKRYGLESKDLFEALARGEARAALEFYEAEGERLASRGQRLKAALALTRGMNVAWRLGEHDRGVRLGLRALAILDGERESAAERVRRVHTLTILGHVYSRLGQVIEARQRQEEALKIAQGMPELDRLFWSGNALLDLGRLALREQKKDEALRRFRDAVDLLESRLARDQGTPFLGTRRELTLGLLALATLQNPAEAEASLRRARLVVRTTGFADTEMRVLIGLGLFAARRGDHRAAAQFFGDALPMALRSTNVDQQITVRAGLGRSYAAQGNVDRAAFEFSESISLMEGVRGRLHDAEFRASFVEDKQAIYEGAVRAMLDAGRPRDAFRLAEAARARAFLDLLGTRTSLARPRLKELAKLEEEVNTKLRQVDAAPEETAIGDDSLEDDHTSNARSTESTLRGATVIEYQRFIDRVRRQDLEHASLLTMEPLGVEEVQALLPEDMALLEYFVTDRETLVWSITRTQVDIVRLPIRAARLTELVSDFRRRLAARAAPQEVASSARQLYEAVFAPATRLLTQKRLLIVPHGVLHYVPFAAFQSQDGRWLVEDYTVALLPSASVLKYLAGKGRDARGPALIVGNPSAGAGFALPFAEREAEMVRAHFPDATVLVRGAATKKKVQSLAQAAGLLHFATHAELNADRPLSSALILASDGDGNNRLEVREIFAMELNAWLVVLSACETGLGELSKGNEVVGLQRAFLYAGTPAVVTTLWAVDDRATYELMRAFYAELHSAGPSEALRRAQQAAAAARRQDFKNSKYSRCLDDGR